MLKKKLILTAALSLSIVVTLVGCVKPSTGESSTANVNQPASLVNNDDNRELIPAIIGYWGGTCEAPIYVAYQNGFFEDAGLDVELIKITQDVALLMVNNELDSFMLTPSVFKSMQQGLELIIIDTLHKGCIQGVASPESGITSVAGFEGKRVGVDGFGGIGQIQASSQMVVLGADPSTVIWVSYPNPQLELALERGEIDAFVAFDPWSELAMQNGHIRVFSNTHDEGLAEYICCFLGMSSRRLAENPEMGRRLSEAFARACEYIEENPYSVAEMIIAQGYTSGDEALTAKLLSDYTWIAGDHQLLKDSFFELWRQISRAGALGTDPDDLEAYIQGLYDKMVVFMGKA